MNYYNWTNVYKELTRYLQEWANSEITKQIPTFSTFSGGDDGDEIRNISDEIWSLLGSNLYQLCKKSYEFQSNNNWIKKFDDINNKIDPLHLFASFNASGISNELRINRISILCDLLKEEINYKNSKINFGGCPTPVVINSLAVRNDKDVILIWKCFFAAFSYRANNYSVLEPIFDDALNAYGVGINSLTIFLFWINSKWFMPLDKNTILWLQNVKVIKNTPQDFNDYKKILILEEETPVYIDIARLAYHKRKQSITAPDDFNKDLKDYLKKKLSKEDYNKITIDNSAGFKIVALKVLPECNNKYSKSLDKNKLFIFDNDFKFDNNIIRYLKTVEDKFYINEQIKFNIKINAIVGKNGTGKSSIVELMLATIYKLNILINNVTDKYQIDEVYTELYVYINLKIYRFIIDEKGLTGLYYNSLDSTDVFDISSENSNKLNKNELNEIISPIYSLCLNYSLFGFNSSQTNLEWVEGLFHRNDTYQFPILIEPNRDNGNIDINLQTRLAKNRLLTNLLYYNDSLSDEEIKEHLKISEYSYAEKLKFLIDETKISKYNNCSTVNYDVIDDLIQLFRKNLNLKDKNTNYSDNELLILNYTKQYLFAKLLKYYNFTSISINILPSSDVIFQNIAADLSFKTKKIWNAINFILFFDKYKQTVYIENGLTDILGLNKLLIQLKSQYDISDFEEKSSINIEHFIPPSFLSVEIILTNNINFDSLSSGEKQLIFSLHTVLYHLRNIDSLSRDDTNNLRRYNYINIVFDEIELYFHPELQRQYITRLIDECIKKIESNIFLDINIIFITHSPFILSDIQTSQTLFLERNESNVIQKLVTTKSLGANIHDLLINGMFLDNLTGEFVYRKIQKFMVFFNEVMNCTAEAKPKLISEFEEKKKSFEYLRDCIGEQIVANLIKSHLEMIINKLYDTDSRIKQLEKELELLKIKSYGHKKNA